MANESELFDLIVAADRIGSLVDAALNLDFPLPRHMHARAAQAGDPGPQRDPNCLISTLMTSRPASRPLYTGAFEP